MQPLPPAARSTFALAHSCINQNTLISRVARPHRETTREANRASIDLEKEGGRERERERERQREPWL